MLSAKILLSVFVLVICQFSLSWAANLMKANNKIEECHGALDIGFIMDASSSVRRKNYNKMKQFIKQMADDFNVSPSGTHFGIIHYSNFAHLDFAFNDARFHKKAELKAKIDSIVYSYGGTRTDKALRLASKRLFCESCSRPEARKVLIVITDGKTNDARSLFKASRFMKEKEVLILSLGIGSKISKSELLEIASEPKKYHVFTVDSFENMRSKLSAIEASACGIEDFDLH